VDDMEGKSTPNTQTIIIGCNIAKNTTNSLNIIPFFSNIIFPYIYKYNLIHHEINKKYT